MNDKQNLKNAVVTNSRSGIVLICPGACGRQTLSVFKEGIVIFAEHFNHEKCRREKHTILIPWDRLDELRGQPLQPLES